MFSYLFFLFQSGKSKEERTGVKRGRTDWSNISEPQIEHTSKYQNSSQNMTTLPTIERAPISVSSKKIENFKGCDWIHEVSITIRRTCRTNIPNERWDIYYNLHKLIQCNIYYNCSVNYIGIRKAIR
jgi:hypothetical protein